MVYHPVDRYISSAKFVFLRLTPVSLLESDISLAVLLAVESVPTLMEGDDMVIRKPGEIYGLVQTLILVL